MVRMEAQLTFFRDKREGLLNELKSDEKGFALQSIYYSPALKGTNASFGQSSKKRSGLKV